jgi:hypothetical protein
LKWQLEDRLVSRYILRQLTDENETAEIVKRASDKAEQFVNGVMGKDEAMNLDE